MKFTAMLLPIISLNIAEIDLLKNYIDAFGVKADPKKSAIIVIKQLKDLDSGYVNNDWWDNYLEDILGKEIAKVAEKNGIDLQDTGAGQFGLAYHLGNIIWQSTGRGGGFWSIDGTLKGWNKIQALIDQLPDDNRVYIEMERIRERDQARCDE